jgi:hypothetical protein
MGGLIGGEFGLRGEGQLCEICERLKGLDIEAVQALSPEWVAWKALVEQFAEAAERT